MVITLKDPGRYEAKLRVDSQLRNVRVILNEADRILKEVKASKEQASDVLTSLDEAFANIVHHGYKNRPDGIIDIDMAMEGNVFRITFTDEAEQGVPPPLPPTLGRALLDKKGNLGIGRYLIHSLMDDVQYERTGIRNRLTIKKKIT